jgi:L-ascorbate metabolism protein UlaG (beta-lactamase superfamily)
MSINRRTFISLTGATVTMIPSMARSAGHSCDIFDTDSGPITIHPTDHASFVMETRLGAIYVDLGDAAAYADLPPAALILVTHEHGDHYNADLLAPLASGDTPPRIVANPAVYDMMPASL